MPKIQFFALIISVFFLKCEKNVLEPESQFLKIHFHYGLNNELNTFEQTYQKDLVLDGTVKIPFWLTAVKQEQILIKVQTIHFFQFPDTIKYKPEADSIAVVMVPNPSRQFLRIQYHQQDKTVNWHYPLPEDNEYVPLLLELTGLIIEIIKSKPEYQSLPPARGWYV